MKMRDFLLLTTALPLVAHSSDWQPLQGIYALTTENYLDSEPSAEPPSHLRIQLTDASARALFEALDGPIEIDECTGGERKQGGAVRCIRSRDESSDELRYECDFSLNLVAQKIEYGIAC